MAKRKKIDLDKIPETLQKIAALVDREVTQLSDKPELTTEDAKTIIAYAQVLTSIYKDYRAEVVAIEKELKTRSKEDIQAMIKAESN